MWRIKLLYIAIVIQAIARICEAQVPASSFIRPLGISASLGSMTGFGFHLTGQFAPKFGVRLAGQYGAGIAVWGIAESFELEAALLANISDDGANDALAILPALGWGMMSGSASDAWWKFSPYESVNHISVGCGIAWIHSFDALATEVGVVAGAAYAIDGIDKNRMPAKGVISPQLQLRIYLSL